MMNSIRFVLVAAVIVGLTACDPTYPLYLRNGLAIPITVQTMFDDGASSEGVLQPGEQLAFLHTKGEIERVVVFSEDRKLHEFDRQALLQMRNSVPDPRQVTWDIQSDAIKPLSRAEVERLKKE